MSKLRTKQILNFATDVVSAMSTINSTQNTAISANASALANLDNTYATDAQVSDAVAVETVRAEGIESALDTRVSDNEDAIAANATAISNLDDTYATDIELSDAVAVEKKRAEGVEASLSAEIIVEKGRIDAILLDSTEALDSFAEITAFMDGVDGSIVARVSTNEDDISDNKLAIAANATAISNLDNTYATDVELSDAVAVEKGRAEGVEGALSAEIIAGDAATLAAAQSYADGLVFEYTEIEAINVAATTFETTVLFDEGSKAEVDVFINGLQIHRYNPRAVEGEEVSDHGWQFGLDGSKFEIVNLGYTLDKQDHVIVSGKLA
jgi:hypothetical protein